ncbi:hypothetical protein [Pseudoxanthomonas sp.]|jgi:hypothetical protein|uniref:hypothetical protein n=1 Tax=Pseudoxanthomonas sp. TaxID=1871049 RepID=UPI002E0D6550|nr:hypothetical protein [Pseudoxanthomonas sp.]
MEQDEEKLVKLGLVMKHFADRAEAASAKMEQGAVSLEDSANAMLSQGRGLASAVADGVKNQLANDVRHALDRVIEPVHALLDADAKSIARVAAQLQTEREAFNAERRKWMVTGIGGLTMCTILAFVGVAAWGIYWNDKSASARAELTWVDAVNQADFVPCGEKRICANVDLKAEPISGKYRPVKPRD